MFVKFRLEVHDTGVGIKKENLKKLFMDFSRLDEHSKMNAQGTGLGLSICKRMIEKMGGSVTVDSEEGQGTTFTVDLSTKSQLIQNEEKKVKNPLENQKKLSKIKSKSVVDVYRGPEQEIKSSE